MKTAQQKIITRALLALISFLVLIFATTATTSAQPEAKHEKFGIGLEIGKWVPAKLNSEPDLSLKQVDKNPYLGMMILKPWRYGLALRVGAGIWTYAELENAPLEKRVQIASILLDLKYALLSDVIVMPYVSYGAGWFLGSEESEKTDYLNFQEDSEVGVGINVGAGFDFTILRNLLFELEFKYHYVKFNHPVVFTDNYSGPKISFAVLYLF